MLRERERGASLAAMQYVEAFEPLKQLLGAAYKGMAFTLPLKEAQLDTAVQRMRQSRKRPRKTRTRKAGKK